MSGRTLGEVLRAAAGRAPTDLAVVTDGGSLTYAALDERADRIAAGLAGRGVAPGDRVVLALPNGLDACAAVFGVARAGAAFCPVNPSIKSGRLGAVLARARPAGILADAERASTATAATPATAGSCFVADPAELGAGGPAPTPPLDVDLAAILFTSGTSGEPKGVALTHRNLTFVTASIVEYLELSAADRVLSVLPVSFGYGLSQLLTCVHAGARLVLEPGLAYPGRVVGLLEEQRITGLPGVPTVFTVLTALDGLGGRALPDLRFLTNAGAALPRTTLDAVRRTFSGAHLYSMYGQTECSSRVCYLPPEQLEVRPESVGVPIPGTNAWVEREDGSRAAADEVGQLMVRGSHVMPGYWEDAAETAARLRPGRWPWERVLGTGDLFRADDAGFLHFVGRSDEIIKSRGEKVAPREVEDVLVAHAAVREAAVLGVPDRLLGDAVHAHVSLAGSQGAGARELRRHCAERLEDHAVPRVVTIHGELPRTPNGKIDKGALRALSSPPEPRR